MKAKVVVFLLVEKFIRAFSLGGGKRKERKSPLYLLGFSEWEGHEYGVRD